MFKLVVLSALVAVSLAAPSGFISPYTYVHQPQTLVRAVPSISVVKSAALVGSVRTSISSQSNTVVHGSNHLLSAPVLQYTSPELTSAVGLVQSSPVVATHAVVGSVPTSVSSHSSTVVHDARPVVSSSVIPAPAVQVGPVVEVARSVPTVQVVDRDVELIHPAQYVASAPSHVVHNGNPIVSAYSPVVVRQSPVVEYSEPIVQYSPVQYSNAVNVVQPSPVVQYSAAAPLSSYSSHGVINSAGYLASPAIVQDW